MAKITENITFTLYNDASVRKKLGVMTKWDAMIDDGRNPETDFAERAEAFLKLGKSYKITFIIEEIQRKKVRKGK